MIAASASNRSAMFIDSSGTHCRSTVGARPDPGQLSATQTSEPAGTIASG